MDGRDHGDGESQWEGMDGLGDRRSGEWGRDDEEEVRLGISELGKTEGADRVA